MQEAYCQILIITEAEVICIVETWLSSDISDNELVISDYQIYGVTA